MAPRIRNGLIVVWFAVSVVCCRSAPPPVSADAAYRDAQAKLRQGDLTGAVAVAEQRVREFEARAPMESWRFRLLQAEAIIWQGRSRDALKLLEPDPPADAGADIAAQRATLQALASIFLPQFSEAEAHLKRAHQLAAGTNPELAIDIALADGWLAYLRTD